MDKEFRTTQKRVVRGGDAMRTQSARGSRRQQSRKSPTARVVPLIPLVKDENPVTSFILNWAPSKGFSEKSWQVIAPITREIIVKVNPGSIEVARKYLRTLARHIGARYLGGHQITNTCQLLDDHCLAQTLGSSNRNQLKNSTRATELGFLYRIRQNLHPEIYRKPQSLKISKSNHANPYSGKELASLLAWSRQRSALRNIRIQGALLLSIACGLDGGEFPFITGDEFYVTDWGLVIRTPGIAKPINRRARFVPVLAEYELEIASLARIASSHPLVGLSENGKTFNVSKEQPRMPNVPNFNGGRARANWTHSLLVNGASYVAMHQAGVAVTADSQLATMSREIVLPFQDYVQIIRGGKTTFEPSLFSDLKKYESYPQ